MTGLQMELAEQERLREEKRETRRLLKAQKAEDMEKAATTGGLFGRSAGA